MNPSNEYKSATFGLSHLSTSASSSEYPQTLPTNPLNPWYLSRGITPFVIFFNSLTLSILGIPNFSPYSPSNSLKSTSKRSHDHDTFEGMKRHKSSSMTTSDEQPEKTINISNLQIQDLYKKLNEEKLRSKLLQDRLYKTLIDSSPSPASSASPPASSDASSSTPLIPSQQNIDNHIVEKESDKERKE